MKLVISLLVTYFIMKACYFKFGYFKLLFHDVFHWHVLKRVPGSGDRLVGICAHCGKILKENDSGVWIIDIH